MVPEIHFLTHSILTPSGITFQTSDPRTHINLTQVRHKSDSQPSFLVVTCKVKQDTYFQNTMVRLVFKQTLSFQQETQEKRGRGVRRKHKN